MLHVTHSIHAEFHISFEAQSKRERQSERQSESVRYGPVVLGRCGGFPAVCLAGFVCLAGSPYSCLDWGGGGIATSCLLNRGGGFPPNEPPCHVVRSAKPQDSSDPGDRGVRRPGGLRAHWLAGFSRFHLLFLLVGVLARSTDRGEEGGISEVDLKSSRSLHFSDCQGVEGVERGLLGDERRDEKVVQLRDWPDR